jgi:hypothetical protein
MIDITVRWMLAQLWHVLSTNSRSQMALNGTSCVLSSVRWHSPTLDNPQLRNPTFGTKSHPGPSPVGSGVRKSIKRSSELYGTPFDALSNVSIVWRDLLEIQAV